MTSYRIARVPGDGIGVDVIDAAWTVLEAAAAQHQIALEGHTFPWSCDYYLQHGHMMPPDGIEQLRGFDAVYLGAVGWPARVPDSVSLHGLLLPIRKSFDQFANVRPHRKLPGVAGPLRAEGFDILCIRENTEGEYGCIRALPPKWRWKPRSSHGAGWSGFCASASSRRASGVASWHRSPNPTPSAIPWCSGMK